jgi:glycosyltransferase involved in cell wall biosynthesis
MARILFVSHYARLGGPTHSLLKLLQHLRRDHEVAVLIPEIGDIRDLLEVSKIPYYAVPLRLRKLPVLSCLIKGKNFDLVYGNAFHSRVVAALAAAKVCTRPFIWHIREMLWEVNWRKAFFLRFADALIAVSQACAQSVKHHVPSKEVHVVYNGVDLEDFECNRGAVREHMRRELGLSLEGAVVVSVGHVCPRKGQVFVVSVAQALAEAVPGVKFLLIGRLDVDPEYATSLVKQVHTERLEDRVHFLGFCTDVPRMLQSADVFLHTAVRDPNPRAVLEAMAARLPVVAFDVDGVSEMVVDGETGYLVPIGNTQAMAMRVAELLARPELRTEMGEAGRQRVEKLFTAERTARCIQQIIADVLQERRR